MGRKMTKVRVFLLKLVKILLTPISRLRKLMRKSNLRLIKISLGVIIIISCIAIVTYLYHLSLTVMSQTNEKTTSKSQIGSPMRHVPLDEVYKDIRKTRDKDYLLDDDQAEPASMVDTPGCKIPVAMLDYEKYLNRTKNIKYMCGNRAIFLRKYSSDKVIARIQSRILEKYNNRNYTQINCCYRFIIDSVQYPHEKPNLMFSNCTKLHHETIIPLLSDFINVICTGYDAKKNITFKIYDDMYAFSKRKNISELPKNKYCKTKYNVLMLGMDSMSLPRAVKTLPRTVNFLKNDNWLGFRGYHKVADHTLPNLMAALTGIDITAISNKCSGAIDNCKDLFIWNAFKKAGYVTGYGEDNLQLRDTLTTDAFRDRPTDHCMTPFFQKEEHKSTCILCSGKASSGQQVLDYALDFVNTYKNDSFFALFWINSFSGGSKCHPEDADKVIENFLNQLAYTGILMNTFVILFSDHGVRFGDFRVKMEGYYDDRMPMNFMWIPFMFKGMHPYEVRALAINQRRLVTPYDLYSTLLDIKRISFCLNSSDPKPDGCPNCHSMFQVVNSNRTCQDAAINDKWCSCHKLYPLPIQDSIGIKSVHMVVNYIKHKVKTINTQRCWGCSRLALKRVIRIHFYYGKNKISLYYVIAFTMTPGNSTYEATVLRQGADHKYTIIGPVSLISNYRGLGNCAPDHRDRLFCVCLKVNNCDIEI